MADKTYVVTAACAVVYNTDHTAAVTVPKGGRVPREADPEHIKMLLDRGLIAESDGEAVGGVDHDPDAAPPFVAPDSDEAAKPRRGRGADSDEAAAS